MSAPANNRSENNAAYPGEFKPLFFNWDEVMAEIKKPHEGSKKPSANVSECEEYYKIEIMAPGHSKDDFIVGIDNNKLSVIVMQTKFSNEKESYRLHEFNFDWFSYVLDLPENIDADFVRAEYRAGILSMYFPKVSAPTINRVHRIIIY